MLSEGEAESQLILELRRLGGVLDKNDFTIVHDGVSVEVDYSSGSSSSLTLKVPYVRGAMPPTTASSYRGAPSRAPSAPRPLCIELRLETFGDKDSKEGGVDREVECGDPAFDDEVYIDTRAPDEAVRWVLAPDEVRAAVRALLALGIRRVRLDDGGVHTAFLSRFATREPETGRAAQMVAAMARLARAVPWVESAGDAEPDRPRRVGIALVVAAVAGFVVESMRSMSAAPAGCVTHDDEGSTLHCIDVAGRNCCAPMGYGFLFGLPIGLVVAWAVVQPIRGRSNSSRVRTMVGVGVLGLTVDLALLVAEQLLWR